MTRSHNSFLNILTRFGTRILVPLMGFVVRRVFLDTIGVSYLGIEGTFTNILSMLSLTELGFETAISYKLYKPIEENDYPRIRALMHLYRSIYLTVGGVILVLGLCMIPLLPVLVKDYDRFAELGLNGVMVFLLYLASNVLSYWLFATKVTYVTAAQKSYLLYVVSYAVTIVGSACQILALVLTRSFIVYLIVQIFFRRIDSVICAIVCDRRYPFLRERAEMRISREERRSIFKDCYALFFHRADTVILNASDMLVLSSLIGLDIVGLYGNYRSVKLAVDSLLSVFCTSIQASLGSLLTVGNKDWSRLMFRTVHLVAAFLYGLGAVGIAILMNDFLSIAYGPRFVVTSWTTPAGVTIATPVALLIGVEVFVVGLAYHCSIFRYASGLFQQLKYRPVASIIINLAVSLLTVRQLGMAGCVLGTIVATVTTNLIIDPLVLHRHVLETSPAPYFLKNLLYTAVTAVSMLISWQLYRLTPMPGLFGFIVHGVICVAVTGAVFLACFFRTKEFRFLWDTLMSILKKEKPAD